jgi:hypothetical protein
MAYKPQNERITIPPEFVRTLAREEWHELCANGGVLNATQCARLWRMTDRQDQPPTSMTLMFSREDAIGTWPPRKKSSKAIP